MAILENIQNSQVVRAYRQGYLVWLGAHKAEAVEENVQGKVNVFFGRTS
jgi:hypothetical protein